MKRHTIFYDWYIDIRSGGPTGYLANLRYGLDRTPSPEKFEVWMDTQPKPLENVQYPGLEKIRSFFVKENDFKNFNTYVQNINGMMLSESECQRLAADNVKSVHVHTAICAVKVINAIEQKLIPDKKIFFTSHCPESFASELAAIYRAKGVPQSECDAFYSSLLKIEEKAFKKSDLLVFPSKKAMDPYIETIPDFTNWCEGKDIRFIPTGVIQSTVKEERTVLRNKYKLEGKYCIAFLGRHNEVKGYDALKKAAKKLLKNYPNVVFLIAGKEEPLRGLKHDRWIELGWLNCPEEVLCACDLFVLPNKRTYFDLILLEALSLGTPVLASDTGGNRSVYNMTDGAIEVYPEGGLESALRNFIEGNKDDSALRVRAKNSYENFFTAECFAQNYTMLIEQIYSDYGL